MTTNPDVLAQDLLLRGGEFIVKDTEASRMFIPEEFNEEQLMVRDMVLDFMKNEIENNREAIEQQENDIAARLLEKMGELGLLGTHMEEEVGGTDMDMMTNTLICDTMGPNGSFNTSYAVQIGIGMLPILFFGTEEQQRKYLPELISGRLKAAYCLTEPGSGSDALAAKTRADMNAEGTHYVLNGQKMWISNAGFADIFIVFAKINGEQFTGFIVERGTPGLSTGAEEKKMGIKGSSTRQVFFENCPVPKENILGEIGKGHHIAFNALNDGRFKLGAFAVGGAKGSVTSAVQYANQRIQFDQPISNFGAIQYKLSEQAIRTFAAESALYRTADLMEQKKRILHSTGTSFAQSKLKAAEEYAVECAILKVAGSEALAYTVDETVQIFGGMGFSEEAPAARAYRDARIVRIYEGTNEINRMLTIDMILKRAMKGQLDLVGPAWEVQKELTSMPSMNQPEGYLGAEKEALKNFKKIGLMVAGAAAKMQMDGKINLKEEQEVLMNIADILIDLFLVESTLLRVEKLSGMQKKADQEVYEAMLQVLIHDANARIGKSATDALSSFAEGDLLKTFLMGLKRFQKYPPVNVRTLRRKIAGTIIAANEWPF